MTSSSGRKWALLIGINEYPHFTTFEQLAGCVNDMTLLAGLLRDRFGFPDEQVKLLTNSEATHDGILGAMEALAEQVGESDIVVFGFAGHGSQMTDREGDEPDGLDETLVPYDSGRDPDPNREITDDQIHAWLQRVTAKTPFVTLIFDCCHSGTISRDAFGAKARSVRPDLRPIDQLPPSPGAGATTRSAGTPEGPSGWLPQNQRYVLLAGCRDDEESKELKPPPAGTPHGALSFHLGQALAHATPGTTYRDVLEQVRGPVRANDPSQNPQMEGALDRAVFGVENIEPMRYVAVEKREGATVTLAAGAAHGLSVGAEWALYPPGARIEQEEDRIGRVAVTQVGAVASQAEVVEEREEGAIGPGARAVEHAPATPDLRLRVVLDEDEETTVLRERLAASPLLHLVSPGEDAEVRIYRLAPREAVDDDTPVPQLGPLDTATWAAVGNGQLLMRPRVVEDPEAVSVFYDNLELITRYRRTLAIHNPNPASVLARAVDVELWRGTPGSPLASAQPEEASGEIVFMEGDLLGIAITNRHTEPVYVNVFDLGLTHSVNPLWPFGGANEALAPGKTLKVGIPPEDTEIPLSWPEHFPFAPQPGAAQPEEGIETIKVFVTTQPADFSALAQPPTRATAPPNDSPLGNLLTLALAGRSTRDAARRRPTPEEDWAAINRSFILRRAPAGAALDADGTALTVGDVTLRTPGVEGQVRVLPAAPPTRSLGADGRPGHPAFGRSHLQPQQTIEIEAARTRSLAGTEPTIEVEVPDPGPGGGQCLLYTDESGVATWQFAVDQEELAAERPATRSTAAPTTGTRTYRIDRAEPAPTGQPGTRGLPGTIGKKILQVLAFPLMDPVIGLISETLAARWEAKYRPYQLRAFTPETYQHPGAVLDARGWEQMASGRALLFLHGPFFRSHATFGGLSTDTLAALHRQYEGRVFAFDHPTLAHDPKRNAKAFLEQLPDGAALDLDLVCHSRGGLVGRVLAEQQSEFSLGSRALQIGTAAFVATPNSGTALADAKHLGKLVDTYTNLLAFIPEPVVTDVLDTIIAVVKQLAVGAIKGLDGLQAMAPGSTFQKALNQGDAPGGTRYCALASAFTPTDPGLKAWATSRLTKAIFGAENDLMVPTESVYEATGAGAFPIEERRVFDAEAGIAHTGFFAHPEAQQQLLTWLQA
ncbi:MAG: hypothetical protein HKN04_07580 [Rhodothermaceae bacterium]|nr:hypothetical protein [Rhodothermaceae bacterium]